MEDSGKNKTKNGLRLARKRRGLSQKQVSYLLDVPNTEQISRYENGHNLPALPVALKLQLILGISAQVLFKDLYERCTKELKARVEENAVLKEALSQITGTGSCAYDVLLTSPLVTPEDIKEAYAHVRELAKKLAYL